MPSPRRRDSRASAMSVVSNMEEEDDITDMEEEQVLRLTVRSRQRSYSAVSAMSSVTGDLVTQMIDIPIIVVTVPHDTQGEDEAKHGWSSRGYKHFKFRLWMILVIWDRFVF